MLDFSNHSTFEVYVIGHSCENCVNKTAHMLANHTSLTFFMLTYIRILWVLMIRFTMYVHIYVALVV